MSTQKRYPEELRERAVRLAFESGRPIAQVAKDLGVGSESLPQMLASTRSRSTAGTCDTPLEVVRRSIH